ncbi:outer membrane porin protein OmpQ [Bordetella ansorpii]|uniref:Outer membrane porin protein OmpQ n=1 Tax=Bordetella ansorpii TaxID=288768 RepID=A0A157SFG4_9BORD|nr:porin [Bordetella ansorpii]SAI69167.1 outer membrane porin protein OmpQ [Bordetella ansorpii]
MTKSLMRYTCRAAVRTAPVLMWAGAACAADPGLALYGVVDAGLSATRVSGAGSSVRPLSGGLSDSLWGLRGSEALDDGWSAEFGLESGFDAATGHADEDGRLFDYGAWTGLSHPGVGSLRLGRQQTLSMEYASALEVGSWRDMGMGALFRAADNYRRDNLVNLHTAVVEGWQAGVGYAFDTSRTDGVAPDAASGGRGHALSAGLKYETDTWLAVLGWDRLHYAGQAADVLGDRTPSAWQAGLSYKMEGLRLSMAWSRLRNGYASQNAGGLDGLGPAAFLRGGGIDTWLLGAEIGVGASGALLLQWSMAAPDWRWQDGSRAKTARLASLGYRFDMSPRTSLYAYAARLSGGTLDEPVVQGAGRTARVGMGITQRF